VTFRNAGFCSITGSGSASTAAAAGGGVIDFWATGADVVDIDDIGVPIDDVTVVVGKREAPLLLLLLALLLLLLP